MSNLKLNIGGIRELLKSQEVMSELQSQAQQVAGQAGHSKVETAVFKNRARARVVQYMTHDDMENNTLLKAVPFK